MKISNEIEIFSGQWKICGDDTFFNGNLLVDRKNNQIKLNLFKLEEVFSFSKSIREKLKTGKYIQGKLFSGEYITLYKCIYLNHRFVFDTSYMEFNIQVMYAFWGLNIDDNPHLTLEKIKINFGDNIIDWYKLHYFSFTKPEQYNNNTFNIEVTRNNSIKLPYNEQLTITFSPSISNGWSLNKRELPLRRDVFVIFEYQSETEWEKILDDILSIQYFIGLGTKQNIKVETIQYLHYISPVGKKYQELYDDIILGTGEINTNIDNPEYLFNLPEFNDFSNWKVQYEKLKPILDLYFVIYTNIQIEIGFLLLIQALETFHARFTTYSKKDYIDKIENLLSNGTNNELLYIDKDKNKDEYKKYFTLRERISDLCYANGNIPFPQNNYQELIKKLVRTRNYYTHYDEKRKEEGIFTISELLNVIRFLKSLLEYHILIIIGFDDKFIKDKMMDIRKSLIF